MNETWVKAGSRAGRDREARGVGATYGRWLLGLFFCPGLHRFYLGMNKSGALLLLLAFSGIVLGAVGLGEIYSSFLGMLDPGGITKDIDVVVAEAKHWFLYAYGCLGTAGIWMLVDFFMIPLLVRRYTEGK